MKVKSEPVKTVLVITVGMLVVHWLTGWAWAFHAALLVGTLGALSGRVAGWIDFAWMKLTWVLSLIVPNIILSLVFFLVLTPVAWLSRLFGEKDPLILKNPADSVFKSNKKSFDPASFEKPW